MTEEEARALAVKAQHYWEERGALGIGFTLHCIRLSDHATNWGYVLTGMGAKGLPLQWRDGAKRVA